MTAEVSLDKVYEEVKRMRQELRSIEKSLGKLVMSLIPEEETSPEERKELRKIEKEMTRGECVSLEEAKKQFGAKRRAKVPSSAL